MASDTTIRLFVLPLILIRSMSITGMPIKIIYFINQQLVQKAVKRIIVPQVEDISTKIMRIPIDSILLFFQTWVCPVY